MNLSKNFTLTEFTKSQTAIRNNIDNTPSEEHLEAAIALFKNVVQPVRDNFGPTSINSGYRGPKLNQAVGGVATSQHCLGEAVDIEVPGVSNYVVAKWIEDNLDFDQLILEFAELGVPDAGWVHVSYKPTAEKTSSFFVNSVNRKQVLTAVKRDGKTVYKPGLIE